MAKGDFNLIKKVKVSNPPEWADFFVLLTQKNMEIYRTVNDLLAVDIQALNLPISKEKTIQILLENGFEIHEEDLVSLARKCVGVAKYRRGAKLREAPEIFDCSSFIKWLYGHKGIWLPRRSIQQREYGTKVSINEITSGDVIFVSGWIDYYFDDPSDGVGHVGIVTSDGSVIHAAGKKAGVIESHLSEFAEVKKFRGARRYWNYNLVTFRVPSNREVEIADDIRWIVLQSL